MAVYTGLSTDDLRNEMLNLKKKPAASTTNSTANSTTDQKDTSSDKSSITTYPFKKSDVTTYPFLKDFVSKKKSSESTDSANQAGTTTDTKSSVTDSFDDSAESAYQKAISTLKSAEKSSKSFTSSYDDQIMEIYDKIVNRDKFQYDINSDMLYQQYARQYQNMGRLAMQDTMGQAAALTGGYASSYSQSVGQQQYDAYLQQLNEVIPELYGMQYDVYQDEGDRLLNQYSMLRDLANEEYQQFVDNREYQLALDELEYKKEMAKNASTGNTTSKKSTNSGLIDSKDGSSKRVVSEDDDDEDDSSYYNSLLGAVSTAKGASEKADYTTRANTYTESVKAVNDALNSGKITKEEATAIKRAAIPGPR